MSFEKAPQATRVACGCICISAFIIACGGNNSTPETLKVAHALYVAHSTVLVSYDIATGNERPGTVTGLASPTDMQALEEGKVMVNLTGLNKVLAVDGRTMVAVGNLNSSESGGTRPVHSYITPTFFGKKYWVALNDGQSSDPVTSKARFIDITPGSATYFQGGEVGLGIGHHKATFSNTVSRAVISNIADCDNVLSVYDYSDVSHIQKLKTWDAESLGWDCPARGRAPAPHGCGTSKVSGKAYCNLTSSGDIVAISIDATPPSAIVLHTHGSGSGYTKPSNDGRYIYSLQAVPREGQGGATCQIGQLVVVDANDSIASEVALLYKGPGCTTVLTGTDEESAEPDHIRPSFNGKTLYLTTAGGFGNTSARVRQELVIDISTPANPVQLASIPVGASTDHHGDALTADGKLLFVANNKDGTVTQIDVTTNTVMKTLTVQAGPLTVATFGTDIGPSEQTGPIQ